jgi:hypothetical protein
MTQASEALDFNTREAQCRNAQFVLVRRSKSRRLGPGAQEKTGDQ